MPNELIVLITVSAVLELLIDLTIGSKKSTIGPLSIGAAHPMKSEDTLVPLENFMNEIELSLNPEKPKLTVSPDPALSKKRE